MSNLLGSRLQFCLSRRQQSLQKVSSRRLQLKTIAGRAAKQKQEKRVAKSNGQGSIESTEAVENQDRNGSQSTIEDPMSEQNPLLPDDPVGSLSEFGVQSGSGISGDEATNLVEEISKGPTAVTYAIWITVLLSAIGVFYGLVFAASGGLSEFLKDKVTFTRKDFVPYSERRRLEDNLKASRQERQEAERAGQETEEPILPTKSQGSSQGLFNLMPAPSVKK